MLAILPNDCKGTIVKFLQRVLAEAQERTTEIGIDLRSSFQAAIGVAWPQANIVADSFPLRSCLDALSKRSCHKEYQDRLTKLWEATKPWPHLRAAWQVKNKMHDLYQ